MPWSECTCSTVFNGKCIEPCFGCNILGEATKTDAAKTRVLLHSGACNHQIGWVNYLYLRKRYLIASFGFITKTGRVELPFHPNPQLPSVVLALILVCIFAPPEQSW
jgi:hypothetical protein